jgi:hypothetical protein
LSIVSNPSSITVSSSPSGGFQVMHNRQQAMVFRAELRSAEIELLDA